MRPMHSMWLTTLFLTLVCAYRTSRASLWISRGFALRRRRRPSQRRWLPLRYVFCVVDCFAAAGLEAEPLTMLLSRSRSTGQEGKSPRFVGVGGGETRRTGGTQDDGDYGTSIIYIIGQTFFLYLPWAVLSHPLLFFLFTLVLPHRTRTEIPLT